MSNYVYEELMGLIKDLQDRVSLLEEKATPLPRVDNEALILSFLEENKIWHLAKSVAVNIGINQSTCSSAMIRMADRGTIERDDSGDNRNIMYRFKGAVIS